MLHRAQNAMASRQSACTCPMVVAWHCALLVALLPDVTPIAQLPVLPMTQQPAPRCALQAAAPQLASTPLLLIAPLAGQAALTRQCTGGVCHMLVVKALLGATIKVSGWPMSILLVFVYL